MKYLKKFENEEKIKGKMIDVNYKIFHQSWDEKPLTLVTDYKIHKLENNYTEIIAKGYKYDILSDYGWNGGFKNKKKKGWIPFNNLNKEDKNTIKIPNKYVQDGKKRIKVYFYDKEF